MYLNKSILLLSVLVINTYSQIDTVKILNDIEKDFYSRRLESPTYLDSIYEEENMSWGISIGTNFNSKKIIELGFGPASSSIVWYHWFFGTAQIGSGFGYIDDKFIMSPMLSLWGCGGSGAAAMGLSLIEYTDFKDFSLYFRPEIGMGFYKFKFVYGYNIALNNYDFIKTNRHIVNLTIFFDVIHVKKTTKTYREVLEEKKKEKLKKLREKDF